MTILTVFLTGGGNEDAVALVEDFVKSCVGMESSDHVDVTVVTNEQVAAIDNKSQDTREFLMAKNLEKLIDNEKKLGGKGRSSKGSACEMKVFLLHDYPATESEMMALMDARFKYPLLDSVVRIVHQTTGEVLSSDKGPESTIQKTTAAYTNAKRSHVQDITEDPAEEEEEEVDISDSITKIDVAKFLQDNYIKHNGHITMDEVLALKHAEEEDSYVPLEFTDILEELVHIWSHLWESKHAFAEWSAQTRTVDVKYDAVAAKRIQQAQQEAAANDMSNIWKREALYTTYRGYVNLLPMEVQTSTAALFGIVVSVAHVMDDDRDEAASLGITTPQRVNMKDMQLPPGAGEYHGSQTLSSTLFAGLVRSSLDDDYATKKNLLVFEDGDRCSVKASIAARYACAGKPQGISSPGGSGLGDDDDDLEVNTAVKNACTELSNFENAAIFRAQVPRLLGQGGIPLRSTHNAMERSILESELLTFTSLSPADIHRFNCLQSLEKLIESVMPKRVNFTGQRIGDGGSETSITKRQYVRYIPGFTLPQLLAKDLNTDPVVLREYYPLADQLLLALVWIPPDRRLGVKEWDPSKAMRVKPTYEEFRVLEETQNFTPRTAGGLQYSINMTTAEMKKYHQTTTVMTPSDKSMVQFKHLASTGDCWLSVQVKDSIIGLRTLQKLPRSVPASPTDAVEPDLEQAKECCGVFVCNTDDDVRITASAENFVPEKKPDRKCSVRSTMTFSNGMMVLLHSQGMIQITSPQPIQCPKTTEIKDMADIVRPFDFEWSRLICNGGTVARKMGNGYIYMKDVMSADGTRILVRGPVVATNTKKLPKAITKKMSAALPKQASSSIRNGISAPPSMEPPPPESKEIFINSVIKDAPENWSFIYLGADGSIAYHVGPDSESRSVVPHSRIKNIMKTYIDAETRSTVCEYRDGRISTHWAGEDIREVRFPDGTVMTTQLQRKLLYIEKSQYPSIEVDVDVDKTCMKHAMGLQVPIAMGGECIRSRIGMPDGSAVFIKYNTKVTAQCNGSIKIVRRNRETVLVEDGGVVTYRTPTAWSEESAKEFHDDCADDAIRRTIPESPDTHSLTASRAGKGNRNTTAGSRTSAPGTRLKQSQTGAKSVSSRTSQRSMPPGKSKNVEVTDDLNSVSLEDSVDSLSGPSLSDMPDRKPDQTKYIFFVTKLACRIEDHENNIFDMDFFNPLNPRIALAGEVDGLKPRAITETFTEPRTFIVDRSADAVEVVREQEVNDLEALVRTSVDSTKEVADAHCPPCDLGGARSHTYFNRRRLGGADTYKFDEIFTPRYWHHYKYPMSSSIIIGKVKKKKTEETALHYPKVYEVRNMIEYPHLSQTGYGDMTESFKRWQEWRACRNIEMDKFRTVDPRTDDDIAAEKDIASKLKKAYKVAKVMANKKREKERERAAAAAKQTKGTNLDLSALAEEKMEELAEDSDEEYDEDDEEYVEDAESIEIRDCFDNYCVQYDDNARIPKEDLRSAFVQLFNRFVTESEIRKALNDDVMDGYQPLEDVESLKLEEFRRLYFKIKGPEGLPNREALRADSFKEPRHTNISNRPPRTSARNFWQTSAGAQASEHLYSTYEDEEVVTYAVGDTGGHEEYVAGSAMQAARRGKESYQ